MNTDVLQGNWKQLRGRIKETWGKITDDDLDQDHMDALSEMLDECEADDSPADDAPPTYKRVQYDLCPECQKRFLRDPLGKEASQKFHFSEN